MQCREKTCLNHECKGAVHLKEWKGEKRCLLTTYQKLLFQGASLSHREKVTRSRGGKKTPLKMAGKRSNATNPSNLDQQNNGPFDNSAKYATHRGEGGERDEDSLLEQAARTHQGGSFAR